MGLAGFIIFHKDKLFRNNYNTGNHRLCFKDKTYFAYCIINKLWLVFKEGWEIGILNQEGIEYVKQHYGTK